MTATHPPASQTRVLTLACADRPGLVADVAGLIARAGGNIVDAQQYDDLAEGRFFMRVAFDRVADADAPALGDAVRAACGPDASVMLRATAAPARVVILVSRFDHCLADLVYRQRIGELPMTIAAIVSNHPATVHDPALIAAAPFHHLPVGDDKTGQEARLAALVDDVGADLVVLARYMQILSDGLATRLAGRCINIHHSFLPGFVGAKPYHQAHARGVKMIGATAHYVTPDLDEGPIIAQDVRAISHADTPDMLVAKGRDIERRVLADAVALHLEHRVLLHGRRTVVFRP